MIMALCSGCGNAKASDANGHTIASDNPYAAEFEKNYAETTDPLVKGILEDGQITEAEISEWADGYASCMAKHDLTWQMTQDGESATSPQSVSPEEAMQAEESCQQETGYMQIMPLYNATSKNPNNLNADELNTAVLACLKANNLVDQALDPNEFLSMWKDPTGEAYQRYFGELQTPQNPSDPKSQQFYACMADPLGTKQSQGN